ncbi:MAG: hypothetical protein NTZ97_02360, partial [Candidatus Moranbacteria bacterium]|nr:hypothetical protein [Candidatus Moranbacteria bacterium]
MSLIEMLIAIFIFTIGMLGFSLLFARSWKANTFIMAVGQSSQQASQGMDEVVSLIRKVRDPGTTGAVNSIADNDLVIFLDYDEDTTIERIHLYLENSQIKRGIREPDASGTYA